MTTGTENVGRPGGMPVNVTQQHRGIPEFTPEEMRKRYPLVLVGAVPYEIRRAKPHEFRSLLYTAKACDLDGESHLHPIHHF